MDMDARVTHPVTDPNGQTCALIKVETTQTGFGFDTGVIQVVKTEQKIGEVWVYVQPRVKKSPLCTRTMSLCATTISLPAR